MARGKKAGEAKKEQTRKDRVLLRALTEATQKVPPDRAPARDGLIDLPKGEGNGKK